MNRNLNDDLNRLDWDIDKQACYDTLQASVYFQEISKFPLLSKEEEDLMAALAAMGYKEVRNALVESNLRLVASIAVKYKYKYQGLSLMDLIQEGSLGLICAAQTFAYTRGARFSTYARLLIHRAIQRAIAEQSQLVRIPKRVSVRKLQRFREQYIQQYHREPKAKELADALGIDKKEIAWLKRIALLEQNWLPPRSLEELIDNDNDEEVLEDLIEDEQAPSLAAELASAALSQELHRVLNQLSSREKEILRLRYGLEDDHQRTLKDVARVFNITRERVRQIEIKGIEKLQGAWWRWGRYEQLRDLWLKYESKSIY